MINNELKQLLDLQEIDTVIDRMHQDLAQIPLQNQEKRSLMQQMQDRADQEKKSFQSLQVKKKEKELEVAAQEEKVRKNEKDLNSVKSNDAYKALLSEIETAKKAKVQVEDEILVIMEETDRVAAQLKTLEAGAKADQQKIEAEIREKEAEIGKVKAAVDAEIQKRTEFAAKVPKDLMTRYDYIRSKKKSTAIVSVVGVTCGGCNTNLTQSVINEARKCKDLVVCESCSRILYVQEAVATQTVAPTQ